MNRAWPASEIDYPESDGQPMSETPLHQYWMIRLLDLFQQRYRDQQAVYVASNLMVYPMQGNVRFCFVPDLIVLLASDRRERRVLKLWEEPQAPDLVVEITSQSTRAQDEIQKLELYAQLGIRDYFLFDPTADYLSPPLQGYRLAEDGRYRPISEDSRGWLLSVQTDVAFTLDPDGTLVLYDHRTGQRLLTALETERKAVERERAAVEKERKAKESERAAKERERQAKEEARKAQEEEHRARLSAEARAAELEAELRRMREQP